MKDQRWLNIVDDGKRIASVRLFDENETVEEESTVRPAILFYLFWFVVALSPLFFLSK